MKETIGLSNSKTLINILNMKHMKQIYNLSTHLLHDLSALIGQIKTPKNSFATAIIWIIFMAFSPAVLVGQNITDPGVIGGDIVHCGFVDPPAITSISSASGGDTSAAIEYQFQTRSKAACAVAWGAWGDATGVLLTPTGYNPGNWNNDREVRRGARRAGFTEFIWSNSVILDIYEVGATDPACNCAILDGQNISDPGVIGGAQSYCNDSTIRPDPTAMTSVSVASGGDTNRAIEYQFQTRNRVTCGGPSDWSAWGNATGVLSTPTGYDPGYWGNDREVRRGARRAGFIDFIWSNVIAVEMYSLESTDPACNCAILSIEANAINKVRIYPNPASSVIKIEMDKNSTVKNISVYSLLGKQLLFGKQYDETSANTEEINVENWQSGIYIVKIETNESTNYQKIIVE